MMTTEWYTALLSIKTNQNKAIIFSETISLNIAYHYTYIANDTDRF